MKTKIATVVGIVLVIVGAVLGVGFAGIPVADITALAVSLIGAGAAAYGIWKNKNPEKPVWANISTIVFICAGAFIAGFCGFSDKVMVSVIGAVASIVLVIFGVLTDKHLKKEPKKVEEKKE